MKPPDMTNARKNRLLQELPRDDAASDQLVARCAACVAVLLVGVATFDPHAEAVYPDRAAAWSHDGGLEKHSSTNNLTLRVDAEQRSLPPR
jgi:hypothetical protein